MGRSWPDSLPCSLGTRSGAAAASRSLRSTSPWPTTRSSSPTWSGSRPRAGILGTRVEGAPDLAIEVLSPSSAQRDRGEKLRLYAESGVPEYWLVDPEASTLEFLVLREGYYEVRLPLDGRYTSPVHRDLVLDVEDFWRRLGQ